MLVAFRLGENLHAVPVRGLGAYAIGKASGAFDDSKKVNHFNFK